MLKKPILSTGPPQLFPTGPGFELLPTPVPSSVEPLQTLVTLPTMTPQSLLRLLPPPPHKILELSSIQMLPSLHLPPKSTSPHNDSSKAEPVSKSATTPPIAASVPSTTPSDNKPLIISPTISSSPFLVQVPISLDSTA